MRGLSTISGCGWAYGFTLTSSSWQTLPQIWESWLCLGAFWGCGWAYGFTLTPLPPQMFLQICEILLKSDLLQVCKPCHYALVDAVEPFQLHHMSMSYIYEVFECLLRLWMGIWLPTHTITTMLRNILLKRKYCVKVVLHSYLELSWSNGKTLQGLHRTHILPCSHQSVDSGDQYVLHSACKGLL